MRKLRAVIDIAMYVRRCNSIIFTPFGTIDVFDLFKNLFFDDFTETDISLKLH